MADILEGLNEAQREAVTATEGYVRVIAGAGSGKTRALSHRFAWLVTEIGVMPSAILCVTFTNKSANEMRRRIRNLTGDSDTGHICTFHSFCATLLQEEAHAVGYPGSFIVLDNADINSMLQVIYEERGLTLRDMTFSDARDMIEMKKTKYVPDYYKDMLAMPLDILRQKYLSAVKTDEIIFYGYLYQEKKCFGLDYNDLIVFTLHIFDTRDDIRDKWQHQIEYVMIDEFQDIDEPQYRLMKAITGYHKNLFIVGDPDQTIYTWRGASVKFLLDFDREFPGTRTIMMNENYRSTPEILAAANSLISRNRVRIDKELTAVRRPGTKPIWFHGRNSEDEARYMASRIRELEAAGEKLSDIAILYRSNFVSRAIEEVFLREELPYLIYSGTQFFDREEIKDALSYLRFIACRDDLSFVRIVNRPRRGIGRKRMALLTDYADRNGCTLYTALQHLSEEESFRATGARDFIALTDRFTFLKDNMEVSELLSAILNESGYEELRRTDGDGNKLDNLAELKQSVYELERDYGEELSLEDYLTRVALFTGADTVSGKNAVRLMTVHTAKGLEFKNVFVCSLSESVFPSRKTATPEAMEEERRLAFVALTRAQDRLWLTDSQGRNLDSSCRYPSRFILDIDKELLERVNEPEESFIRDASAAIEASVRTLAARSGEGEFRVGDRIVHKQMGPGEIVDISEKQSAYVIRFDALPTERRISFRVKLTREES